MSEEIFAFLFLLLMLIISNIQAWVLRTYYRKEKKHTFKLLTSSFVEPKPEPVGAGTFWTELKPE